MSPSTVRRYRAERLLREEFERLRGSVIASVSGRLRAGGVRLDASDIDAAYAQAWQGLYAAMLEGQEIANPAGWLALVTYRRAIDEHRARRRVQCAVVAGELEGEGPGRRVVGVPGDAATDHGARTPNGRSTVQERDLAAELDDRTRLRQLFEALRGRLSAREQQAATLCYLQGLSRSEAAARMGVSKSRMRKLMEGRGTGSPGVAGKVGALVETIRAGEWCEQQGSLMRGFAYGILDPAGERYRLALIHRDECPACRAYVLSLRGLAAVLPPVPWLLHWALGAGASTGTIAGAASGTGMGAGAGAASGTSAAGAGAGTGAGTGVAAPTGAGIGGGALSASGAAGAGAAGVAGGGWWLAAGPLGAKLAVGCLLALGVGAGCVAIGGGSGHVQAPAHRRHAARDAHASRSTSGYQANGASLASGQLRLGEQSSGRANGAAPTARAAIGSAAQASREFGPEQATAASGARTSASAGSSAPTARAASVEPAASAPARSSTREPVSEGSSVARGASSSGVSAAEREFAPG